MKLVVKAELLQPRFTALDNTVTVNMLIIVTYDINENIGRRGRKMF
jgi:hypothetical protein